MPENENDLLSTAEVAAVVGVTPRTLSIYLTRARKRRSDGGSLPGDMPEPDLYERSRPKWRRSTVDAWIRTRPGQGWSRGLSLRKAALSKTPDTDPSDDPERETVAA